MSSVSRIIARRRDN